MVKIILPIVLLVIIPGISMSQSCSVPQPLTREQKEMVKGEWRGHYLLNDRKTGFTVSVDFSTDSNFVQISNPPLEGETLQEEYRFCGAGAFHFKKVVGGDYYEFDGVPEGASMAGTLVVQSKNFRGTGKFYLEKMPERDN